MYISHIWRCDHVNFHCDASETKLSMKPAHFIYFLQLGLIPFVNLSQNSTSSLREIIFLKKKNRILSNTVLSCLCIYPTVFSLDLCESKKKTRYQINITTAFKNCFQATILHFINNINIKVRFTERQHSFFRASQQPAFKESLCLLMRVLSCYWFCKALHSEWTVSQLTVARRPSDCRIHGNLPKMVTQINPFVWNSQ